MSKYLYGAAVQGIQGFIFQTNKLAEIVGASEIVEQICTKTFSEFWKGFKGKNLIMGAAGNIKYVFENGDECKEIVLEFPKAVMEMAPGITISQAVIEFEGNYPSYEDINDLEIKLKSQRNRISIPFESGFMSLERARRTGGVVYGEDENMANDKSDEATLLKLRSSKNAKALFHKISNIPKEDIKSGTLAFDIADITRSGKNSWIAVIHADGNGLGNILQNQGQRITENNEFKTFSEFIQLSTEAACQAAFNEVIKKDAEGQKDISKYKYPIRPVVIGGDDVTIIIRADLALDFTVEFLKAFEAKTAEKFKVLQTTELHGGLTACAGIAYVKESYPLHYALNVAEQLCKDAKKMVKNTVPKRQDGLPKSSLAFYRVQDSFVENLGKMKSRTLHTGNGIDYDFGPYLLKVDGSPNVNELKEKLDILATEAGKNAKSKSVSKLRQLISESFKDVSTMNIMKDRMKSVNSDFYKSLALENDLKGKSMLYDLIQLHSFKY